MKPDKPDGWRNALFLLSTDFADFTDFSLSLIRWLPFNLCNLCNLLTIILFMFLLVKLRCFFYPIRTCSISPHPTMSAVRSSFVLSLWYQIQDNNTKYNTQHEQFILRYASHCRSARLAVGSHRAINQFHRRMLLCPHHRLLYGMAVHPSHL